jgi:hypothetical protein
MRQLHEAVLRVPPGIQSATQVFYAALFADGSLIDYNYDHHGRHYGDLLGVVKRDTGRILCTVKTMGPPSNLWRTKSSFATPTTRLDQNIHTVASNFRFDFRDSRHLDAQVDASIIRTVGIAAV